MFSFFFFNDTAPTEIYTLSLHDALPISSPRSRSRPRPPPPTPMVCASSCGDRKSTRLNSSHTVISYAVFCLKKKKHNSSDDSTKIQATHEDLHDRVSRGVLQ